MRIIAHLDMDAFFASVEEKDKPYLKGCPLVVGSDPEEGNGRGVVSTANYLARGYGIHSAMPIKEAWRRSILAKKRGELPVIFISPSFARYEPISRGIFSRIERAIYSKYRREVGNSILIEKTSIDEAYIDLSFLGSYSRAIEFTRFIKEDILRTFELTISVGVSFNKLLAKIASDHSKPNGMIMITEGEAEEFLSKMSVRVMPGVGPKFEQSLNREKIFKMGDIKNIDIKTLFEKFGRRRGEELWNFSRGQDDRILVGGTPARSIGEQDTLPQDVAELCELLPRLYSMAGNIWKRLRNSGYRGCKTIALTVRFSNFTTRSRSRTFGGIISDRRVFERFAVQLLLPFLDSRDNSKGQNIRMIGLRVEKLKA